MLGSLEGECTVKLLVSSPWPLAGHPRTMRMWVSSGDVVPLWCPEPVGQYDAGASGTPNCCSEHATQILHREAPPDGCPVRTRGGCDGSADRALCRARRR